MKTNPVQHNRSRLSALALVVSTNLLISTTAFGIESKPHKSGDFVISNMITSSLGYGDNLFRNRSNEQSSTFLSVQPTLQATKKTNEQELNFTLEGDGIAFFDSSEDNYLGAKLSSDYTRDINAVSQFGIGASYEDGSTVRGTDITEGTDGDVEGATDFTRKDIFAEYKIGSQKVGPSLELAYNYTDLEFDNFLSINQGRDYQLSTVSARLGYQYSVATKFFIDLGYSDFDYDAVPLRLNAELDGTEQTVLFGVSWRISRATTGEISLGSTDKDFDNFADPSSITAWNVSLEWLPTARDSVTLEGFSRPFEQAGTGLFQDVQQISLSWEHDVSRLLSISAGISSGSVDFGQVARDDDFDTLKLGVSYRPTRYSEWSLNYEREEKDSNLEMFNFETNTIYLSYSISL